jgi:hypothetical protein
VAASKSFLPKKFDFFKKSCYNIYRKLRKGDLSYA